MDMHSLRAVVSGARRRGVLGALFPKQSRIAFRARSAAILDRCFFDLLRALEVQNFVECGAHDASASVTFMQHGSRALAIEANPLTYQERTKRAEAHGVTTLNIGLGATQGALDFYIPTDNPLAGNATFRPKRGKDYRKESVPVETLNHLQERYALNEAPCALWMDLEGLAFEVLQGGDQLLAHPNCRALKVEVETFPFFEGQKLFHDVNSLLESYGFQAILADHEYREQFNVLYVKAPLVDRIMPLQQKAIADMLTQTLSVQELFRIGILKQRRLVQLKDKVS